jgi:arylformamidase
VEGLDLSAVHPGTYTLACLPLRITDGDGGPARAALIEP